jgi:hypothetical protein
MNRDSSTVWQLLVVSLPTGSATARMRIWRALKALGCMALRDGAYLTPGGAEREQLLQALADECSREGGSAWLMQVVPRSCDEDMTYRQLFDRSSEFAELRSGWKDANRGLAAMEPTELVRLQRKLQREFDALRAIDFFPTDASVEAEVAWVDLAKRIDGILSPDEPHETAAQIQRLAIDDYQGRIWATRQRLWVDRVASAWLIKRFIDPEATFNWVAKPADRPKSALGFDFDGATFTHVANRVTFETLMASFGLESDVALMRLARMVHQLDVGGDPVPESAGFEAMLAGARELVPDDDALLIEMSSVLDSLYAHFQREAAKTKN